MTARGPKKSTPVVSRFSDYVLSPVLPTLCTPQASTLQASIRVWNPSPPVPGCSCFASSWKLPHPSLNPPLQGLLCCSVFCWDLSCHVSLSTLLPSCFCVLIPLLRLLAPQRLCYVEHCMEIMCPWPRASRQSTGVVLNGGRGELHHV